MSSDNGHLVQQDDSAMDFGGPGYTWCGRCKAVYGTPAWAAQCPDAIMLHQHAPMAVAPAAREALEGRKR